MTTLPAFSKVVCYNKGGEQPPTGFRVGADRSRQVAGPVGLVRYGNEWWSWLA